MIVITIIIIFLKRQPKAGLQLLSVHVAAVHHRHKVVSASLLPVGQALEKKFFFIIAAIIKSTYSITKYMISLIVKIIKSLISTIKSIFIIINLIIPFLEIISPVPPPSEIGNP